MIAGKKNFYIAVAGIMGSGKTTAARLLAKKFGSCLLEEKADENIFLPLFYKDPKRWALSTQLFFLAEKAKQLRAVKNLLTHTGVVHDSPIHQDRFTYAKAQHLLGNMSQNEYAVYQRKFNELNDGLLLPDLIINLEAPLSIICARIKKRERGYEKRVDASYLRLLSDLQNDWISKNSHLPILTVQTGAVDLVKNRRDQNEFIKRIKKKVRE